MKVSKSYAEIYQDFLDSKYGLYMEVGNMSDINNMLRSDYYGLMDFISRRNKISRGEPVGLRDSQRDMIRRAKEEGV